MKALSTTILIVVTAVVILVAALVLLTIFGGGMGQISALTNFENQCRIQCAATCKMNNMLPPTWGTKVRIDDKTTKSCEDFLGKDCSQCGGTASDGTGSTQYKNVHMGACTTQEISKGCRTSKGSSAPFDYCECPA